MKYTKSIEFRSLITGVVMIAIALVIQAIMIAKEISLGGYYYNADTIWYSLFESRYGYLVSIVSPIFITIGLIYPFFVKLRTGSFINLIQREPYQKHFTKTLLKTYGRAFFLFPFLFLITYAICNVVLDHSQIVYMQGGIFSSYVLSFSDFPHLFPFFAAFIVWIYSLIIINFALVITHYVHKFYYVILALFLSIFVYNHIIEAILTKIFGVSYFANLFRIFIMMSHDNPLFIFLASIFTFIVSFLALFFCYRKKESLVLNYE